MTATYDVVIRNGTVVDGTGRPAVPGDVAILDGRIAAVGTVDGRGNREIDAAERIVSPGFVDIHTHLDAQVFWDRTLSPSPLHGVTTVVAGNCGFTVAPLDDLQADYLMRMLARVEGMPLEALMAGVPWNWRSTGEYLDRIGSDLSINAGFMVGHSAMRRVVMGGAANERTASDEEIAKMVDLLRAGLRAGGLGFTSTWSANHNDADGHPVPSRLSDERELVALSAVCSEVPGTSLEFLPRTPAHLPLDNADVRLLIAMSRAAGRPLNWNLLQATAANADVARGRLELGRQSLAEGARVVALYLPQQLPIQRSFINGFGLDSIRGWASAMALPHEAKLRMLADPAERQRLHALARQDAEQLYRSEWGNYEIVETFAPGNESYVGKRVDEIAQAEGKIEFDALLDIVVSDELRTYFREDLGTDGAAEWELRADLCRDPGVVVGGSDAGAHLDMIGYANYCTKALANLVREHQVLSIEEMVHFLSSRPARLYGIRDRGELRVGAHADVVVFDLDRVDALPLVSHFDLPAGCARLYSGSVGVDHVIVNGQEIVEQGELNDQRPGDLLRSGTHTTNPSMVP